MTVNGKIINALSGFGYPVEPDEYTGTALHYFTFNYNAIPSDFSDDDPEHERILVQVHYVCPLGESPLSIIKAVKQRLRIAGFVWPTHYNATLENNSKSPDARQHHVFETEIEEGVDLHGV